MVDGPRGPTGPQKSAKDIALSDRSVDQGATGATAHSAEDGQTGSFTGAHYYPEYYRTNIKGVVVDPDRLRDLQEWNQEEMHLFWAGEFFFAGALWLFVENLFADPIPVYLLLFCAACIIFGVVLFWVGLRQRRRRTSWLDSLIENSEKISVEQINSQKK